MESSSFELRIFWIFTLTLLLTACSTVSHYGARPKLESLEAGMSPEEVIENLGKPAMQEKKGENEAFIYGWDNPWDSVIGAAEEYFVLFKSGRLVQYGMITKGAATNFGIWRAIESASAVAFPINEG